MEQRRAEGESGSELVEASWRPEILAGVLKWTVLLGGLIAGTYLLLSVTTEPGRTGRLSFWLPFLPYAGLVALQRCRSPRERLRAAVFATSLWLIGLLAAFEVGLGPGPVLTWALTVVATGLFLGSRAMLVALGLTTASMLGLGWVDASGVLEIGSRGGDDGSLVWLRQGVVFLATTGATGVLIAHVVHRIETALARSLSDQRQRRRAEEARERLIADLEAKNAELERYAYTVSHDLKSPLVTIRGFLGVLERDALAGDRGRVGDDVARIGAAIERMSALLRDLLELSRVGQLMAPPEVVGFRDVVDAVIEANRSRLEARGARVEVSDGLPDVYADRERLVEVVQNLLDNAIAFSGERTPVRIGIGSRSDDANGQAVLFVRDEGIGIPERFHSLVFGLFEKLDARSDGTGVGLALVKRIVEAHGGRVWVESEGEGCGSTFVFTVPRPPGPA